MVDTHLATRTCASAIAGGAYVMPVAQQVAPIAAINPVEVEPAGGIEIDDMPVAAAVEALEKETNSAPQPPAAARKNSKSTADHATVYRFLGVLSWVPVSVLL